MSAGNLEVVKTEEDMHTTALGGRMVGVCSGARVGADELLSQVSGFLDSCCGG